MMALEIRVGAVRGCDGGFGDRVDTVGGCDGGFGTGWRCDGGFGDSGEGPLSRWLWWWLWGQRGHGREGAAVALGCCGREDARSWARLPLRSAGRCPCHAGAGGSGDPAAAEAAVREPGGAIRVRRASRGARGRLCTGGSPLAPHRRVRGARRGGRAGARRVGPGLLGAAGRLPWQQPGGAAARAAGGARRGAAPERTMCARRREAAEGPRRRRLLLPC